MTTTALLSNHPHLVTLGALRGRVTAGYLYRQTVTHDDARWDQAAQRWNRLTEAYLTELRQAVEGMTRADLTTARDELTDRLERGWAMLETEAVVEQFTALVSRYEAVEDALAGVQAATRRINDLDRNLSLLWVMARQQRQAGNGRRR